MVDGEMVDGDPEDVEIEIKECVPCSEGTSYCTDINISLACYDGYWLDVNICKKCKSPCATCISDTFCHTCGYDPTNVRTRVPQCSCPEHLSDHGDRCDTCTAPCAKCTGFGTDECTECLPYYYLEGTECLDCHVSCYECTGPEETDCLFDKYVVCRDGYYFDNSSLCVACQYPCKACVNDKYCLTCDNDVENRYDPPTCICKEELYEDTPNK